MSAHMPDDSFAAVVRAYLASPTFLALAASTQDGYRRYLNLAARPTLLGARDRKLVRPALVQGFLDGLAHKPGSQTNARVALKALEAWAVVRDLIPYPITTGTVVTKPDGGHKPWTDRQIECAELHADPDISRAITLAASTGQRGSDLIKMCWTDIEKNEGRPGINVVQRKTGNELWIPMTRHLQEVMETWERRPGPILLCNGKPWGTRAQFTMAWTYERDTNAELVPCRGMVLHGLRASACVRLRRLGATESQISDMVGLSVPMVTRYCRQSAQKDNAMAAVHYLDIQTATVHEIGQGRRKRDADVG